MPKITNNFLNKLENTFKQKQFKEEKVHDVELQDCIVEGERHDKLVKIAGSLSRQAYSESALKEALLSLNETLCENPLPEKEVEQIAKSIFKYANYKTNPDLQNNNDTVSKVISLLYSSKGNANERSQKISDFIIDDLNTEGKFITTSNDDCYFFSNNDKTLIQLNPESINYKKLISEYRINPQMRVFNFLHQAIIIYCFNNAENSEVYKFAHYDTRNNKLYIKCGVSQMYIVDTKSITLVDNGTDGVLFSDIVDSEPFEYIENIEKKDYIFENIIALSNFNDTALEIEVQQTLAKAYFLSLFMPEFLTTKPILTIIGSKGSGKTTLLKAIVKTLYGRKHNVCSVPSKLDDLDVLVANSHFLALDNWDTYKADASDKIAVYATGAFIKKRKLYTDSTMYEAFIDAFIGMSARALNFKRDDIIQRLILLEVIPIPNGYIPESELMKPLEENRNYLMSQAINEVQHILQLIESKKYFGLRSSFRMADFANFLTLLLDDKSKSEEYLKKMTQCQQSASIENDVIIGYLVAYVEINKENWHNANEMYKAIVSIDKDESKPHIKTDFEKSYESVFSFAKRLNNIKNDIKDFIIVETRKGRANSTEYCIKKGLKFDELDKRIFKIYDQKENSIF